MAVKSRQAPCALDTYLVIRVMPWNASNRTNIARATRAVPEVSAALQVAGGGAAAPEIVEVSEVEVALAAPGIEPTPHFEVEIRLVCIY